jgi:nitronate monooxygenase
VRTAAARAGRAEFLSLWAGQAVALARSEPAAAIVERIFGEAHLARDASARFFDRSARTTRNREDGSFV